jgi:hypothetical protein
VRLTACLTVIAVGRGGRIVVGHGLSLRERLLSAKGYRRTGRTLATNETSLHVLLSRHCSALRNLGEGKARGSSLDEADWDLIEGRWETGELCEADVRLLA